VFDPVLSLDDVLVPDGPAPGEVRPSLAWERRGYGFFSSLPGGRFDLMFVSAAADPYWVAFDWNYGVRFPALTAAECRRWCERRAEGLT
jgi:hypothetical protein